MPSSSIEIRLAVLFTALLTGSAMAKEYGPYPKRDSGHVTDLAGVLSPQEEERIEQLLYKVAKKSSTEIIVLTIDSIDDYDATANSSIESFATELFNRWGIGNAPRNDGILLLVAVRDRKARIELGAGYEPARDRNASKIMEEVIVPRFRQGDFSGGISRGVKAIVNEFTTVSAGVPWKLIMMAVGIVAFLLIGFSLLQNGKRGWGWVFVGLALVLLLFLLVVLVAALRGAGSRHRRSRSWASGGSGGGFGGGFSSGGGATGSW
ncbi:MAG TPA: TPM domain-containing protein [Thermoanaerobaculia bacterium]|nr:TPM domain-containing protein [Thermoanaerobaculia bacterium]